MNEEIPTTVCAVFEIRNTFKSPKAPYGVKKEMGRSERIRNECAFLNQPIYLPKVGWTRFCSQGFRDYCSKAQKNFKSATIIFRIKNLLIV